MPPITLDANSLTLLLIIVTPNALLLGYLLGALRSRKTIHTLQQQQVRLEAELEHQQTRHQEQMQTLQQTSAKMEQNFKQVSNKALRHNSEVFLNLATQNFKQYQIAADADLAQREKGIATLVQPIKDALDKTHSQIQAIEKERKQTYGSLSQHITHLMDAQKELHGETRNLVQALRRPEVRGRWGEITLKRLVELAGMIEHCDFYEQEQTQTEQGAIRPDMIIRMPDQREVVVDVKTPLDAFLNAIESSTDTDRKRELQRHARVVQQRVKELAQKAYWKQFKNAPDFVVLFLPGEQFLSAALEIEPDILENALRQHIIIATPTSFIALLRAVAYGWRQVVLAKNAEKIRDLGEELYTRIATFTQHLNRVGKGLTASIDNYNKAVGTLERQVLPSVRKFNEMGIAAKKSIEQLDSIETTARSLEE